MIGRPSQPDLGNTSVGKSDDSGPYEESAAFLASGKAAFLLARAAVAGFSANYERISL